MARPRYRINSSDWPFASAYLGRLVEQRPEGFPGRIDWTTPGWTEELYRATEAFNTSRSDAEALQHWCDKYLSERCC